MHRYAQNGAVYIENVADPGGPAPPTHVKTSKKRWLPGCATSFASHRAPSGSATGNRACMCVLVRVIGEFEAEHGKESVVALNAT